VLEAAREVVAVDRLLVWAVAPEADRLVHVTSSGLSKEDRRSLGERLEIPLAQAGSMARAYREKMSLVVDEAHPLPGKFRLKPPYSAIKALRTKSFVVVPILARGRLLGLLVADNKYRRTPLAIDKLHLLPNFALHIATAVDNASVRGELQAFEQNLAEAVEQQTATSEILRVISSPDRCAAGVRRDRQEALRLIEGIRRVARRRRYPHLAAITATNETGDEALRKMFLPLTGQGALARLS
jgi:GAF domain-containing protein